MVMQGENMKIDLPPGYKFYPSDQELILHYLKPKFLGHNLVCDIIKTTQLYGPGCTPWKLFDVNDNDYWIESFGKPAEKFLFVFTTLSKLRSLDSNKARCRENTCKKAGCGTWGGKTGCKLIRDREGNVIGEKRLLVFEVNDVGGEFDVSKAGYFKMHEYSICGVNKGLKSAAGVGDLVLCKITYDSKKMCLFKLGSKSTTDRVSKSICEDQEEEQNMIRNGFERSADGNLEEGTGNLTSENSIVVNCDVLDNVEGTQCLTSEDSVLIDSGVGDSNNYLAADQHDNGFEEFNDFGGDSSFDMDWLIGLLNSNEEEEAFISNLGKQKFEEENLHRIKLGSRSIDPVFKSTGEDQKEEQNMSKNDFEGNVDGNLEGTGNLTSDNAIVVNCDVGDNIEGTQCLALENLVLIDSGVGDSDNYLAADQYDNGFEELNYFGGDSSSDMDWLIGFLNSNEEVAPVEDSSFISNLGKRKFEEEILHGTKRTCLG